MKRFDAIIQEDTRAIQEDTSNGGGVEVARETMAENLPCTVDQHVILPIELSKFSNPSRFYGALLPMQSLCSINTFCKKRLVKRRI